MEERSYTLGRILAVYQAIEELYTKDLDSNIPIIVEKIWNRYIEAPQTCLMDLEEGRKKSKELYSKPEHFNNELYEKFSNRLDVLLEQVDKNDNSCLDYNFFFGFKREKTDLVMMEVSNLKEMRAKLGLTQKQTSEYLGVPIRTWENWENEYRTPPKYVEQLLLEKMATLL